MHSTRRSPMPEAREAMDRARAGQPASRGSSAFERAFVRFLERPRLGAWLALAAFILSSSSLFLGFHLDDHVGRYIYSSLPGAKRLFDLYAGGYGLANGVPADT